MKRLYDRCLGDGLSRPEAVAKVAGSFGLVQREVRECLNLPPTPEDIESYRRDEARVAGLKRAGRNSKRWLITDKTLGIS